MYIANTYIGGEYTPGEIIRDDLSADKLEWLIRAGAVREAAPAPTDQKVKPIDADEPAKEPVDGPEEAEADGIDEEIDVMAGIVMGAEDAPAKKPVSTAPNGKKRRKEVKPNEGAGTENQ